MKMRKLFYTLIISVLIQSSCAPLKNNSYSNGFFNSANNNLSNIENLGTVGGGGGKSVVCRNPDKSIKSVELLDIFEAKNIYGLSINESSNDMNFLVENLLPKLKGIDPMYNQFDEDGIKKNLNKELDNIKKNLYWVKNSILILTDDSYEKIIPKDCTIEQLINYTEQGEVFVDYELWTNMNSTNQAAALLHETLYSYFRNYYNEKTSVNTRSSIGLIFSGYSFDNYLSKATSKNIIKCINENDVTANAVIYEENKQIKLAIISSYERKFFGLIDGAVLQEFKSIEDFQENYKIKRWEVLIYPNIIFGLKPRIWAYNYNGNFEINDQSKNSPNAVMRCDLVSIK